MNYRGQGHHILDDFTQVSLYRRSKRFMYPFRFSLNTFFYITLPHNFKNTNNEAALLKPFIFSKWYKSFDFAYPTSITTKQGGA